MSIQTGVARNHNEAGDNIGVLGRVHGLVKTEHKTLGSGDEKNETEWAHRWWLSLGTVGFCTTKGSTVNLLSMTVNGAGKER